MSKLIWITTRRYSTYIHRILDEYSNITVNMDGQLFYDKDISHLRDMCTNEQLKRTLDFLVVEDNKQLFGFHDYMQDIWADISEIDFIKQLAKEKIIRYRIYPTRKPFFCSILHKLGQIVGLESKK